MKKFALKPSNYFFEQCGTLKSVLLNDFGVIPCIIFWLLLPLLPSCIFGWYLADIIIVNLCEGGRNE